MADSKKAKKAEVKIEKLPKSQVKIFLKVFAEEFEKFLDEAAKELSKEMKFDGFRQGSVPRKVIESKVGSQTLLNEGAEKAVKKTYVNAILDNKIEAIGQPEIHVKKVASGNDFEFEAIVAVLPEVKINDWREDVKKINGNYKGQEAEVDEKEVDKELEYLANQRAKVVTVNREAKNGDQAEIDFEVLMNNVPIERGTAHKHQLVIGKGTFIPGFEEQLVGMKASDEKEFELEFPKDYRKDNLAGKKAKFKVKMNLVQEREMPEINDEFASGIGKFKNLEELKENLRKGIAEEKNFNDRKKQEKEVLDKMTDKTEVELPEILLDGEVERMMSELQRDISSMGLDANQYFQQVKTTEEKLKKQWRENEAPKRVKAALVLKEIAKEQELEPESKEIEERMNSVLQYYKTIKQVEKDLDLQALYENIKAQMRNEKAVEYLLSL